MKSIQILHLSDVHFGVNDPTNEQERITNRVIIDAHDYSNTKGIQPHLVIFTGDITHSGNAKQFSDAEKWLKKLLKPWPDCKLCIVPGNHDLARPRENTKSFTSTKRDLRWASADRQNYQELRKDLLQAKLFKNFLNWHASAKKENRLPLISDWNNGGVGFSESMDINGMKLHLIGVNTALLSLAEDKGQLAVDIHSLNGWLGKVDSTQDLVAVVGHHPVGLQITESEGSDIKFERWFCKWNDQAVEELLFQEVGPHLYFHGHMHAATGWMRSNSTGQSLTVLGAGAAYQGSSWPQHFSFYDIDFNKLSVTPTLLKYSNSSGTWIKDEMRSQPFRTTIPSRIARQNDQKLEELIEEHQKLSVSYQNVCSELFKLINSEVKEDLWEIKNLNFVCKVSPEGDADIKQVITIQAKDHSMAYYRLWVAEDTHSKLDHILLEDFRFDVSAVSNNGDDVAFVPARSLQGVDESKNYVIVFFLPKVAPYEKRTIDVRMKWPKLFGNLSDGKEVMLFWEYEDTALDITLEFDADCGEITCENLNFQGKGDLRDGSTTYIRYWQYKARGDQNARYRYKESEEKGYGFLLKPKNKSA